MKRVTLTVLRAGAACVAGCGALLLLGIARCGRAGGRTSAGDDGAQDSYAWSEMSAVGR